MHNTILHLSDIQYGRHHVDKDNNREPLYPEKNYSLQLEKILDDLDILKNQDVKPGFIVVTGDIAELSRREEYQLADKFLSGISGHLKIDRRCVIMVPGNHDINRNVCKAIRTLSEEDDEKFKRPYFVKFKYYQEFFHKFYEQAKFPKGLKPYKFAENQLFVNFYFPDQGIVFVGLNSCIDESEIPPHRGNITTDQVRKAIDDLNAYGHENRMMRIALMHHNFIRSPNNDDENLIDADEIKPHLIESNFKIILHGHQHVPNNEITGKNNNVIHILATGSAGLDSETLPDNSRRYQIIDIHDNQVKVYMRVFDNTKTYKTGKGAWRPDLEPSQKDIYYEFKLSGEIKKQAVQKQDVQYNGYQDSEKPDQEIKTYCKKAESLHSNLPVAGFVTQLKAPIDIDDIYVPLHAMINLRGIDEELYYDAKHAQKCLKEHSLEISLPDAFKETAKRGQKGIVILGDPGSGKTTHLKRVLLWCLRKGPDKSDLHKLGLPENMLPIFLPLRELTDPDKGLDSFIQKQLTSVHLKTPPGFGERLLKRGNLLFLLDGLDEVANLNDREKVSKWIKEAIDMHTRTACLLFPAVLRATARVYI